MPFCILCILYNSFRMTVGLIVASVANLPLVDVFSFEGQPYLISETQYLFCFWVFCNYCSCITVIFLRDLFLDQVQNIGSSNNNKRFREEVLLCSLPCGSLQCQNPEIWTPDQRGETHSAACSSSLQRDLTLQ